MSSVIPKKIVFVLGAGASAELNLPMGSELTKHISAAYDFRSDGYNYSGGDAVLLKALEKAFNARGGWYNSTKLIANSMPLAPSIDNFVDVHRNDPTIAFCAKLAITKCILAAERNSSIFQKTGEINFSANIAAWHTLFFRNLTMYCTEEDLQKRLRSIAIVSFNYDRCFEHFLFNAIKTYYSVTNQRAAELLSNLEIHHPYGQVGILPYMAAGGTTSYGKDVEGNELIELSKQIRTFTESTDSAAGEKIRELMFNAESLVFLGFAFHPLNVNLLFGEPPRPNINYQKRVYGTAFGSSKNDTEIIASQLHNLYRCEIQYVGLRNDLKCSQLFNEYSRSLSLV